MENMKLEPEVLRPLLHKMNDISKNRQIFLDSVRNRLEEIAEELRSAKSATNSPEKIQKLDTNVYKQRLIRLSQKIQDFKESCQLQTLSQEQTTLESELREFESNLHKYESATGGNPTSVTSSNKENKKCNYYMGIQDFHALIAKTGYTDNWSNEDHLLFLKLRKKCSSIATLVAALQVKCPDLTVETIVNHEAWYKIYLNLREKQRVSIKKWRKQKEIEKIKNSKSEIEMEALEDTSQEKKTSNIIKKLPICMIDKYEKITKTCDFVDTNNADRKKELIKQWKIEKENKRLIDEEQSKILIESKLAMLEKRKRERLRSIQEALKEYRERKSIEISSKASKGNTRTEPKYNPMLIEAFRKQDEEYTSRKKSMIMRLQKSAKNRMTKTTRSQLMKKRDYSTVLNSTKVWRERCKMQNLNTNEPKKLLYIKDVPRLYVHWRNKESGDQGCPGIF
ncbi:Coiled-coil domain-containing protein 112 [Camponotus japonicus]